MESVVKSIKINNLRSICMTESIKLLPITVLIGKNSAGKSTFGRSFPLIRQSCEAKKRAPILWFGDRVDFGSFEKSIYRRADKKNEIEFTFDVIASNISATKTARALHSETEHSQFGASIFIAIRKAGAHRSLASRVQIDALGYRVSIRFSETNNLESLKCNTHEWRPQVTDYTDAEYLSILPKLNILREMSDREGKKTYGAIAPFYDSIVEVLNNSDFSSRDYILMIVLDAPVLARGALFEFVISRLRHFDKNFNSIDFLKLQKFIENIEEYVFASKINQLIAMVDESIKTYYSGVKYIEPLRATAQRYYRKQELALDEIDSRGENLAMFLDNVGPWFVEEFNDWTTKHFGFYAKTINEGGHVAIVIGESGSKDVSNLADIGFGFSQILPVITQMWLATRPVQRSKRTNCIVIEQPELHLHPSFQAKLADVFSAVAGIGDAPHLIIETHSNHIVNRFGQLISEGKLKHSDVQILIFEKVPDSESIIRKAGFDEDGYFVNWPIGFFEPEM